MYCSSNLHYLVRSFNREISLSHSTVNPAIARQQLLELIVGECSVTTNQAIARQQMVESIVSGCSVVGVQEMSLCLVNLYTLNIQCCKN